MLISGLFLIIGGFTLSNNGTSSPVKNNNLQIDNDVSSFSQEPVSVDSKLTELKKTSLREKAKLPPIRIIIPSVNIDIKVKESKIVNGFWEVFPDSAGFGLGSSYPQDKGNQVIFAHARKGLFLPLNDVKIGQIVYVLTQEKWYKYTINNIKEVLPTQTDVISFSDDSILTLYTCSGFADSKRLIITAAKEVN